MGLFLEVEGVCAFRGYGSLVCAEEYGYNLCRGSRLSHKTKSSDAYADGGREDFP